MIVSLNPATGVEFARYPEHTDMEVDAALTAVTQAQTKWRFTNVRDRTPLLRRIAEVLRSRRDGLARIITAEMGKPLVEALAEIDKCAWNCAFYADNAEAFLTDEIVPSEATESFLTFEPLGVVLAIMPWNYPFWQFFRCAAPILAAGNGIVLKHANNVPQCALAIADVMKAAACPDGLCETVLVPSGKVADIIADDRIAAITLTGSTEVGKIVASQAGRALKKQVLELGGSDPFIVLADADVEQAAATAVKARFINVGQSCVNAKRFIVDERVADEFATRFCAGVKALVVGDPLESDTQIGPLARADLRETLHRQVERTVASGATLRAGGHFLDRPGFFYAPTVLDNVTADMAAFREETFGPVAAIIRAANAEEAISLANQTEFGLGASLWTGDVTFGRQLARRLDAGAVFVNGMVASDPRLPFGGIKQSGYGRELGVYGIREFVNVKTVWIGPTKAASA